MTQLTFSSNFYSNICFKLSILKQIIATELFTCISSINNKRSLLRFQSTTAPTNRGWSACAFSVRLARFTHSHDHPKGLLTLSLLSLFFCWAIILSWKHCSTAKTVDEFFQTLTIVATKSEADKRIYSTICVG